MTDRPVRLVIVDRDGVINEDSDDYIKSPHEWRAIPGSVEAIGDLYRAGFEIVVVTNQSGLARGFFSEDALRGIHARMTEAVRDAGGEFAGIYYCPHLPSDDCDCRKPRPGLVRQLERDLNVSAIGAPFIGDKVSDVDLAAAVGGRPLLVRTGRGREAERALAGRAIETFADLRAAANALLAAAK